MGFIRRGIKERWNIYKEKKKQFKITSSKIYRKDFKKVRKNIKGITINSDRKFRNELRKKFFFIQENPYIYIKA